jgi:hypothetical protein
MPTRAINDCIHHVLSLVNDTAIDLQSDLIYSDPRSIAEASFRRLGVSMYMTLSPPFRIPHYHLLSAVAGSSVSHANVEGRPDAVYVELFQGSFSRSVYQALAKLTETHPKNTTIHVQLSALAPAPAI